ncbi:hypothetical protein H9P43_007910 [Blastocladiella emersonii ATCC 22665]|nr:hypothetical protein H9P43_007910 [Blastocladiella emersonii ATCC 22665]
MPVRLEQPPPGTHPGSSGKPGAAGVPHVEFRTTDGPPAAPSAASIEARHQALMQAAWQRTMTRMPSRLPAATPAGPDSWVPDVDTLLDSLLAVYHDVKAVAGENVNFARFAKQFEPVAQYLDGVRINAADFEVVQKLASGAFGMVSLVRGRHDGKLYALKALRKSTVVKQENVFFMEERDVMAFTDSSWITTLYAAFQDEQHLYLVMEYLPGGDLISLLESRDNTSLTESEARFYMAELVVAVAELHARSFAHRDLKPHNILIDRDGHIKLADFGSCIQVGPDKRIRSQVSVGTPDYISPEVLSAQEGRGTTYGVECDWWAVGVVLYEILCGDPPFYAESLSETYANIQQHKGDLEFDDELGLSDEVKDLMNRLLSRFESRLGRNGVAEIQQHPWFAGIDWSNLRGMPPPFIPELESETDTRYFPQDDDDDDHPPGRPSTAPQRGFAGAHLPFVGYTYLRTAGTGAGAAPPEVPQAAVRAAPAAAPVVAAPAPAATMTQTRSRSSTLSRGIDTSALRELESQLASATAAAADAASRASQLALDLATARADAADARSLVETVRTESTAALESAQRDVQQLRARAEAAERHAGQLTADLAAARTASARAEDDVAALRAQLKRSHLDLIASQGAASSARSELADVQRQLDAAVAARERDAARHASELHHASEAAAAQKAEVASLIKAATKLEIELRSVQRETQAHEMEANSVMRSVQEDLVAARSELASEREKAAAMAAEIATRRSREAELDAAVADWAHRCADATAAADDARRQLAEARAREEDRVAALSAAEANAADLQRALRDRDAHVSLLGAAVNRHESTAVSSAAAIEALRGELAAVRAAKTQERTASERRLAEDLALAREKTRLQAEDIDRLTGRIKMHEETIFKLQERLVALDTAGMGVSSTSVTGNGADKPGKRLKTEHRDLQQRFAETQARLTDTEKELQEARAALVQAQAMSSKTSLMTTTSGASAVIAESPNEDPNASSAGGGVRNRLLTRRGTLLSKMKRELKKSPTSNGVGAGLSSSTSPGSVGTGSAVSSPFPSSLGGAGTPLGSPYGFGTSSSSGGGEGHAGLRGWLKIPKKDGFLRHGWKWKYFVVRDYVLYMWDKEREVDSHEGALVVDLRIDLFAVMCVNPHDLYHVTTKEIPCIFKIQALTSPSTPGSATLANQMAATSMPSLSMSGGRGSATLAQLHHQSNNNLLAGSTSPGPVVVTADDATSVTSTGTNNHNGPAAAAAAAAAMIEALESRIKQHRDKLEVETKMLAAADRLVLVSKGAARMTATQQYQQTRDRIEILETELAALTRQHEVAVTAAAAAAAAAQEPPRPPSPSEPSSVSASVSEATSLASPGPRPVVTIPSTPPPAGSVAQAPASPIDFDSLVRRTETSNTLPLSASPTGGDQVVGIFAGQQFQLAGHYFKATVIDQPVACRCCHETLTPAVQAIQCPMCFFVAHKSCASHIHLTCGDVQALNGATPVYLMCESAEEKKRWLHHLDGHRRHYLAQRHVSVPMLAASGSSRQGSMDASLAATTTAGSGTATGSEYRRGSLH